VASEIRWRNGPCHHPADHVARSGDKDRFARFRDVFGIAVKVG
jgi:hypothetical protein